MPCALAGYMAFLSFEQSVSERRSTMSENNTEDLSLLGKEAVKYEFDYNPDLLETFDNSHQGRDYFVKLNCPEFTTLCPITGQPDFATLYISYIP